LAEVNSIVGWVEVTKPFDYRSGQRPTSQKIWCWVSLSAIARVLMKYFSHKSTATYLLNLETASRNGKVLPKNAFSVPGTYLIYNKIIW